MSDVVIDDTNDCLHCPRCGGTNLHHHTVTVNTRFVEDGPGASVTVNGPTEINIATDAKFSGRRDDLTIDFSCEECDHDADVTDCPDQCGPPASIVASLNIMQHKGSTYVSWGELKIKPTHDSSRSLAGSLTGIREE